MKRRQTPLLAHFGGMSHVGGMVPFDVSIALRVEVDRRNRRGEHAARGAGHPVTTSDVLRSILLEWSRKHGPVRWWSWNEPVCHAAAQGRGKPGKALCGYKLPDRACLDLGGKPCCPKCTTEVWLAHLRSFCTDEEVERIAARHRALEEP